MECTSQVICDITDSAKMLQFNSVFFINTCICSLSGYHTWPWSCEWHQLLPHLFLLGIFCFWFFLYWGILPGKPKSTYFAALKRRTCPRFLSSGRQILGSGEDCDDHILRLRIDDAFGRESQPDFLWFLFSALMLTSGQPLVTRNCIEKPSRNDMTETQHEAGSPQRLGAIFFMGQSWWTDSFSFFWIDIHAPQLGTKWEGDWNTLSRYFPSFP